MILQSASFLNYVRPLLFRLELPILFVIGLLIPPSLYAGSINPTLTFQHNIQHNEYNRLAHVILKEAYRRIGHPVAVQPSIADTKNKQLRKSLYGKKLQIDGILIAPSSRELNQNYIRIPVALFKMKVFAYAHKSQEHTAYEFGLLGNRVSVVKGMPMIKNSMSGLIFSYSSSVNHSFKLVSRNKMDLVLLPELLAISRSKKHLRSQVVALQPAVYEVPMYHYVSKKNKHLINSIASSIEKMKKQQLISSVTQSFKNVLEADSEA